MNRIAAAAAVLLVLAAGLSGAQQQCRPFVVSVRPAIDIPLPPDPNLFQLGGGVAVSGSYVLPFFRPLSAGIAVTYHLGRLQHADLGSLGSLSVLSAEVAAELCLTVLRRIDGYLSGGAGYFYAVLNGDPSSWAASLVWSGRVGVGFRVSPALTVGIQSEYRRYESLYHLLGVGAGLDLRLGGVR